MIALAQSIRKYKVIICAIGFVVCSYIAFMLTSFLSVKAADDQVLVQGFEHMVQAGVNYLNYSTVSSTTSAATTADPSATGGTTAPAGGASILGGNTGWRNSGGIVGYAASKSTSLNPDWQGGIAQEAPGLSGDAVSYSYATLATIPIKIDENGEVQTRTSGPVTYARYGHALNEMGLDQTNVGGNSGLRMLVGIAFMLLYILSLGVNGFFSLVIAILQIANPYRLFAGAKDFVNWMAPSTPPADTSSMGYAIWSGVKGVSDFVSEVFDVLHDMSMFVILPLFLALTIYSITILRGKATTLTGEGETSAWGKIKTFLIRFFFVIFGVPIMFGAYDGVLSYFSNITAASNSQATRIVASTFLDFGSWVERDRLDLPDGTTITVDLTTLEETNYAGRVDGSTLNSVRKYCYLINQNTEAYGEGSLVGNYDLLDVGDSGKEDKAYDTANMTVDGNLESGFANISESATTVSHLMQILSRYAKSDIISAGTFASKEATIYQSSEDYGNSVAWAQMVADSQSYKNFDPNLATAGAAVAQPTQPAQPETPPEGEEDPENPTPETPTVTTPTVTAPQTIQLNIDWDEKDAKEAANARFTDLHAWNKAKITGKEQPKHTFINPWANGGERMAEKISDAMSGGRQYTYYATDGSSDPLPDKRHGLSTMAMYNYLNSDFTTSSVNVYGGVTKTMGHYSVVAVGSSVTRYLYVIDALILLCCVSIVGYLYGLTLIIHNFRGIFKVLPAVFGSMFGSLRSIASAVALLFVMILEVVVTFFVYHIAIDLLTNVTNIIEWPFTILLKEAQPGLFKVMTPVIVLIGIVAMIFVTSKLLTWRKVFVSALSDSLTAYINKLFATRVATPSLAGKGGSGALRAASTLAGIGMVAGGVGGSSSLAEKLGISKSGDAVAGSDSAATVLGVNAGDTVQEGSEVSFADGSSTTTEAGNYGINTTNSDATNEMNTDMDSADQNNMTLDNMEGDATAYDEGDSLYSTAGDMTEGDTIQNADHADTTAQYASRYVNENSDFLNEVQANTEEIANSQNVLQGDALSSNQTLVEGENVAGNVVGGQNVGGNVSMTEDQSSQLSQNQQVREINKNEAYQQGSKVVDSLVEAGNYVTTNDQNVKNQAIANVKSNAGDMKNIHQSASQQRNSVINGGSNAVVNEGNVRTDTKSVDQSVNGAAGSGSGKTGNTFANTAAGNAGTTGSGSGSSTRKVSGSGSGAFGGSSVGNETVTSGNNGVRPGVTQRPDGSGAAATSNLSATSGRARTSNFNPMSNSTSRTSATDGRENTGFIGGTLMQQTAKTAAQVASAVDKSNQRSNDQTTSQTAPRQASARPNPLKSSYSGKNENRAPGTATVKPKSTNSGVRTGGQVSKPGVTPSKKSSGNGQKTSTTTTKGSTMANVTSSNPGARPSPGSWMLRGTNTRRDDDRGGTPRKS